MPRLPLVEVLSGGPDIMSVGTDALSFQIARVRLQLMLLLSFPLPLPVHVRTRISEPGGHPSGEGRQSHGPGSEIGETENLPETDFT